MSVHATSWAWRQKIDDPVAKLLLLKLADQANDDGVCWPSRATLAEAIETSEATVKRRVKVLVELGLIEVRQRWSEQSGHFSSNEYHLRGSQLTRGRGSDQPSPRVTQSDPITVTQKLEGRAPDGAGAALDRLVAWVRNTGYQLEPEHFADELRERARKLGHIERAHLQGVYDDIHREASG